MPRPASDKEARATTAIIFDGGIRRLRRIVPMPGGPRPRAPTRSPAVGAKCSRIICLDLRRRHTHASENGASGDIALSLTAGRERQKRVRLSPGRRGCLIQYRRRLQRRDVDGAIRRSRADGWRLDGERDGSRSRGPCRPAAVKRQQWWWSRGPPSVAQGRNDASPRLDKSGGQADGQRMARVTRRRRRGAERQPVAEGESPPWLRSRHRATRRTSPMLSAGMEALARWRVAIYSTSGLNYA